MNTLDDQLLDDLNDLPGWEALTASPSPAPSSEALDRSATAVREAIAVDAARARSADVIRSRAKSIHSARRRRTRWAVGAGAVAAAAALVIAAPTLSTPGIAPVSVASASEFLTHLAAIAPAVTSIDAAYWKVTSTSVNLANPAPGSDQVQTTTVWYGRNGGEWIQTGSEKLMKVSNAPARFTLPSDAALSWAQVAEMSSDPIALDTHLKTLVGARGSIIDAVGILLATAPLTSSQRAAMFTILSTQPGVTKRDFVKDELGRIGTALDFPFGPTETVTLLLADDGTLLEVTAVASVDHEKVLDSPRLVGGTPGPASTEITKKGRVLSRQTYLSVGGTNTTPGA